jgi:hypothetical protein
MGRTVGPRVALLRYALDVLNNIKLPSRAAVVINKNSVSRPPGLRVVCVDVVHALWHIEWLARGIPTTGIATWPEAYLEFRKARTDFLTAVRRDLGVRGTRIAHDVPWPPPWRPSNDTRAGGS